jgi:hypothetical protein
MMHDGMMWGMGIGRLAAGILAILAAAVLVKYVLFR